MGAKSTQILAEMEARLLRHYGGAIAELKGNRVERLVQVVSGRKLRRMESLVAWLNTRSGESLSSETAPSTNQLRQELLQFPNIGPETADSILLLVLDRPVLPVGAGTHRIFWRHGLVPEQASYEELQEIAGFGTIELERYRRFHSHLAKIAREYCRAQESCEHCPLKGLNWD